MAEHFEGSDHRFFFLRHGGPPPKALHQSGLTMSSVSVHGEPKFSEGQPRVFTNLVRVKKHCMTCTMGLKRKNTGGGLFSD